MSSTVLVCGEMFDGAGLPTWDARRHHRFHFLRLQKLPSSPFVKSPGVKSLREID